MACPPLRLAVPSDVLPSLNVTVPPLSNVPENWRTHRRREGHALTVPDELDDEVTVVLVLALLTVCSTLLLLPVKFVSPL